MIQETPLRIAPRRSLMVTALVSIVLVLVPISAVLYWFAIPRGQAGWVALAQAAVVVGSLLVLVRQLTVDTVVDGTELRGRGIFSPMVRVPLSQIAAVDLVPVYVGQSHEPVLQLLVRDTAGRRLYRLRGHYWHDGDLDRVAAVLPVATTAAAEPMSLREFYRAYPGSAYWFENRPWLIGVILAAIVAACVAIAVAVMHLLDMPVMG